MSSSTMQTPPTSPIRGPRPSAIAPDTPLFKTPTATSSSAAPSKTPSSVAKKLSFVEPPSAALKAAYRALSRCGKLAWGTHGPIYGENTLTSMERAINAIAGSDLSEVVFLDVGAGVGGPSAHAAVRGARAAFGIEIERTRWWLSQVFLAELLKNKETEKAAMKTAFALCDLAKLESFGPVTHVYAFDVGFPPVAFKEYARVLKASRNVRRFASFQSLAKLESYGFPELTHLQDVAMKMVGSGESKTLHVYQLAPHAASKRKAHKEQAATNDEIVLWPEAFAVSTEQELLQHASSYAACETKRGGNKEAYLAYVREQIGFQSNRDDNQGVGSRTRSKKKGV